MQSSEKTNAMCEGEYNVILRERIRQFAGQVWGLACACNRPRGIVLVPLHQNLLANMREYTASTTEESNGEIELLIFRFTVRIRDASFCLVCSKGLDDRVCEVAQCECICQQGGSEVGIQSGLIKARGGIEQVRGQSRPPAECLRRIRCGYMRGFNHTYMAAT